MVANNQVIWASAERKSGVATQGNEAAGLRDQMNVAYDTRIALTLDT